MTRRATRRSELSLFEPGPRAATAPQPAVRRHEPFLHPCEVCGAWGAFGVDVFRHQPGFWFCGEHKP